MRTDSWREVKWVSITRRLLQDGPEFSQFRAWSLKPPALILYWEEPRARSTRISGWRWIQATDLEASFTKIVFRHSYKCTKNIFCCSITEKIIEVLPLRSNKLLSISAGGLQQRPEFAENLQNLLYFHLTDNKESARRGSKIEMLGPCRL